MTLSKQIQIKSLKCDSGNEFLFDSYVFRSLEWRAQVFCSSEPQCWDVFCAIRNDRVDKCFNYFHIGCPCRHISLVVDADFASCSPDALCLFARRISIFTDLGVIICCISSPFCGLLLWIYQSHSSGVKESRQFLCFGMNPLATFRPTIGLCICEGSTIINKPKTQSVCTCRLVAGLQVTWHPLFHTVSCMILLCRYVWYYYRPGSLLWSDYICISIC